MKEKKKRKPGGGRKKSTRELKQATYRMYADQLPATSEEVRAALEAYRKKASVG